MPARQKKNPPRIPPAPSCGAETRIPPNFRKISLGFANPPPAKLFRKTESAFVFSVSPHFCFSRSSVLRTEALQRAGNASIQYHQDCFQKRFEFCTMNTVRGCSLFRNSSRYFCRSVSASIYRSIRPNVPEPNACLILSLDSSVSETGDSITGASGECVADSAAIPMAPAKATCNHLDLNDFARETRDCSKTDFFSFAFTGAFSGVGVGICSPCICVFSFIVLSE